MDLQNIADIIAALAGLTGGGVGVKSFHNHSKLKEKINSLEQQVTVYQTQFTELKMHIMNIETKIDLIFMNINNVNTNEININKAKEK